MYSFSTLSLTRLATCDVRLQQICEASIKRMDFSVICGHRGELEQNDAFEQGRSKLKWPLSRHNKTPSQAVDLAPYPINWQNADAFKVLAMIMLSEAAKLHIPLRWGGDFNRDRDYHNDRFVDLPHYELDL